MLLLASTVVLYAVLWLRGTWVANENDKAISIHFMFAADRIIRDPEFVPTKMPPKVTGLRWFLGFLTDWASVFQLATSALLVVLLYLIPQMTKLSSPN
jgi:hypothetical protein